MGASVALSADGLVFATGSSHYNPVGALGQVGRVRVFQWNANTDDWEQRGQPIVGVTGGSVGYNHREIALSADGAVLAIGSPNYDGGKGIVRVYDWNGVDAYVPRADPSNLLMGVAYSQAGNAVVLSADGSIVAMGLYQHRAQNNVVHAGTVRVFEWDSSGGTWTRLGTDQANMVGLDVSDMFGAAIALSADGHVLAVGAPDTDHPGIHDYGKGQVHVYAYNSGTNQWDERDPGTHASPTLGGNEKYDYLGKSVALSADGSILAASALQTYNSNNNKRGYARVWEWNGQTQSYDVQVNYIYNVAADDQQTFIGTHVALNADGTVLAVGITPSDSTLPGRVDVHAWDGASWTKIATTEGEDPYDHYGNTVALSADATVLATGASQNTVSDLGGYKGRAYVYTVQYHASPPALPPPLPPRSPVPLPAPPPPPVYQTRSHYVLSATIPGEAHSVSMSADGTRIAFGPHYDCADDDGHCAGPNGEWRVMELTSGGQWVNAGYLPADSTILAQYGDSIALSRDGAMVAVWGRPASSGDPYTLRVFEVTSGSNPWQQRGQTLTDSNFAHAALSADGSILAYGNNNAITGEQGVVRVYQYDASSDQWGQIGPDMTVPSGTGRQFYGERVALSADGFTVFANAAYHDGPQSNTGIAMVHTYDANADTWNLKGNAIYGPSESYQGDGHTGVTMSADGTRVAIGRMWTGDGEVSVLEYDASSNTWEPVGPPVTGSGTATAYGSLVQLSADGHTLIVAHGPHNQHSQKRVEVLVFDGAAWTMIGLDGPVVGEFVATNDDGSRIAVPEEGYAGGNVRIYDAVTYPSPPLPPHPRARRGPAGAPAPAGGARSRPRPRAAGPGRPREADRPPAPEPLR